jgi:5-methylcytosine-specific restriction endonuclease McrA
MHICFPVTPIPYYCDNPDCQLHYPNPTWGKKKLILILDHINGIKGDNRPKNLRLLCPNCNSQQPTHGGGNRNRIILHDGGHAIKEKDGKINYTLITEPGVIKVIPGRVKLTHRNR